MKVFAGANCNAKTDKKSKVLDENSISSCYPAPVVNELLFSRIGVGKVKCGGRYVVFTVLFGGFIWSSGSVNNKPESTEEVENLGELRGIYWKPLKLL